MISLTNKQKLFVQEYLATLNATQSAICAGYSERSAYSQGQRLLKKDVIKQAVQEQMDEVSSRNQIKVDDIVNQLAKIAFSDIKDFVTWDECGNVKVKKSDDVDATLIAEISSTETANGKSFRFKRNDQLKALELLSRHLGMLTDKKEITGANGGSLEIRFVDPDD